MDGTTCLDFMTEDLVVPIETWREEAFEAFLSQGRSSGLASSVLSSGIPVTPSLSSLFVGAGIIGGALVGGLRIGTSMTERLTSRTAGLFFGKKQSVENLR